MPMAWLHRSGGMMAGFQYACIAKYKPITVPARKTKNAMRTRLTKTMIALGPRASRPHVARNARARNDNDRSFRNSTARDIPPVEKLRECLTEGENRCAFMQLSQSS